MRWEHEGERSTTGKGDGGEERRPAREQRKSRKGGFEGAPKAR